MALVDTHHDNKQNAARNCFIHQMSILAKFTWNSIVDIEKKVKKIVQSKV